MGPTPYFQPQSQYPNPVGGNVARIRPRAHRSPTSRQATVRLITQRTSSPRFASRKQSKHHRSRPTVISHLGIGQQHLSASRIAPASSEQSVHPPLLPFSEAVYITLHTFTRAHLQSVHISSSHCRTSSATGRRLLTLESCCRDTAPFLARNRINLAYCPPPNRLAPAAHIKRKKGRLLCFISPTRIWFVSAHSLNLINIPSPEPTFAQPGCRGFSSHRFTSTKRIFFSPTPSSLFWRYPHSSSPCRIRAQFPVHCSTPITQHRQPSNISLFVPSVHERPRFVNRSPRHQSLLGRDLRCASRLRNTTQG